MTGTGSGTGAPASMAPPTRPTMTVTVVAITAAVSVAALINTSIMDAMTTDLGKLRNGQWWGGGVASPVMVQPSGWGQLTFNLTGLAVVGAALERLVSRPAWLVCFLTGGVGSVVVLSAWEPADGSGGTSDAVAALIGALAVVAAVEGAQLRAEWPSQLYSVFFATYLTGLAVGGIVPSIIAGDLAVIACATARRVCRPDTVRRGCLVVVATCGAVMTVSHQGHGVGIVIAGFLTARRRMLASPRPRRRRWSAPQAANSPPTSSSESDHPANTSPRSRRVLLACADRVRRPLGDRLAVVALKQPDNGIPATRR
jgi:membrane associated rhomboid family serine protease